MVHDMKAPDLGPSRYSTGQLNRRFNSRKMQYLYGHKTEYFYSVQLIQILEFKVGTFNGMS